MLPIFEVFDFKKMRPLNALYAYNLTSVTKISKLTFFYLSQLREMALDGMSNMKKFDDDLLMRVGFLKRFSAQNHSAQSKIFPLSHAHVGDRELWKHQLSNGWIHNFYWLHGVEPC